MSIKKLRKINFVQVVICFCLSWCLEYYLFLTIFGSGIVPGKHLLYNLALPSLMFFIIGTLLNYNAQETGAVPFLRIAVSIIILLIIDQGIKLAVIQHQEAVIPIIDDWLEFRVYLHKGHFANSKGIYFPLWFLFIVLPVLLFLLFRIIVFYQKNRYLLSITMILLYAALLCSCIDKILYGGSYDYIYLKQFGILDLKDIYVTTGQYVLFQTCLYNQSLADLKKELFSDPFGLAYFRYEYCNLKRLLSKSNAR